VALTAVGQADRHWAVASSRRRCATAREGQARPAGPGGPQGCWFPWSRRVLPHFRG